FSVDEEYEFVSDWCRKTNSEQFEIRFGNEFAGMISLSHIDMEKKSARVGYWVGSEYRKRGICSKAFELILNEAEIKGIKEVRSNIDKNNEYSLKIWDKYNPEIIEKNEKQYTVRLTL
ncbi:MAG: GNAT family N-acetyltransferase, partial [Candidatus Delongbacteria bacterium]|nr:GNAT family N-acetyltransferase [Candidatus Delongbacteria bacterium]